MNLYQQSAVRWRAFKLEQVGTYTEENVVRMRVTDGGAMRLNLRMPGWAEEFTLRVKGLAVARPEVRLGFAGVEWTVKGRKMAPFAEVGSGCTRLTGSWVEAFG